MQQLLVCRPAPVWPVTEAQPVDCCRACLRWSVSFLADAVVAGKSMADWLRFSVCFWHTFRGKGLDIFGASTIKRDFDDESSSLRNAKRRLRAAFALMSKLGMRCCFGASLTLNNAARCPLPAAPAARPGRF